MPERRAESEGRPAVRIGDRDREQAVTHLGTAFGEGRLDLAEYDERVAAAYNAKTASDLLHLTADLPLATREHPASSDHGPAPATGASRRPDKSSRSARVADAEAARGMPGWLRAAWVTYLAAVSINLVIWLIVSVSNRELIHFWPMWVAGPWGVILLFSTFGGRLFDPGR